MLDQYIDGIIFFCGYDLYEHIKQVHDSNIPVVVLDREIDNNEIPSVLVNNFTAMESAVQHFMILDTGRSALSLFRLKIRLQSGEDMKVIAAH